jgi:two-component system, OmpR family, sensor histidine kinase CiaH
MFASARAKLTLWYLLLIVMISGTLSLAFYFRFTAVLRGEYERIDQRFQRDINDLSEPVRQRALAARRINLEDLRNIRRAMILQLLIINAAIVVVFSIGGYVLSGLTLEPIEEAHEQQRRFVGDAAHELRTPISALKTTLEVNLLDKKLPAATKVILKENLEEVTNLEHWSESLLRLAKVTEQSLVLEKVSLKKAIDGAVKFLAPKAKQKAIKVVTEVKPETTTVKADQGALLDLCIILLDNALKYSPEKSQVVILAQARGRHVVMSVTDQGIGINQYHLPRIFDRFYRVDQSRTAGAQKGYGLGLAVAKKIIQQHHGAISVKSKEGEGTTFSVTLPLA